METTPELLAPATRLPELRAAKRTHEGGWTQAMTAAAAGITHNRYWRIENREAVPTDAELERLATIFGVTVGDIVPSRKAVVA